MRDGPAVLNSDWLRTGLRVDLPGFLLRLLPLPQRLLPSKIFKKQWPIVSLPPPPPPLKFFSAENQFACLRIFPNKDRLPNSGSFADLNALKNTQ